VVDGGFHIFAFLRAGSVPPQPWPSGMENGEIVSLPAGAYVCVAQRLAPDFLARLTDGRQDTEARTWLMERAIEHGQITQFFAEAAGLPLGFGVVVTDPAVLPALLAAKQADLDAFFAKAAGNQEWCLKFFVRDEGSNRAEVAKSARSGLDYLAARRAAPLRQAAKAEAAQALVDEALSRIEPLCEEIAVLGAGSTPAKDLQLLRNLALLVPIARSDDLQKAAEALVGPAAEAGLEISLTGPWPLFSFRPRIELGQE
jgi:hypothetical protein